MSTAPHLVIMLLIILPLGLKMVFFPQSSFKKQMLPELILFSYLNLNASVCVFKPIYWDNSVMDIKKGR